MLGKLFKYEWKYSWRVVAVMNGFLIIATLLGMLSFRSSVLESENVALNIFSVLSLILYYLSIIVVSFAVLIFVANRFFKNMYGDEGYLMHTLPVSPYQHVIAKTLVSSILYLITFIVIIFSIAALGISFAYSYNPDLNIPYEISKIWAEIAPELREELGMPLGLYFALLMVGMIISLITSILMIYAAISLGQMFHRHKVMGSIISYIGLIILEQTISSYIAMPQSINSLVTGVTEEATFGEIMNSTLLSAFLISLAFGVIFYILTVVLMKRKMNLD